MLKTERNTKTMERIVRSAAAQKFGRGKVMAAFEHGQWWVMVDDVEEDRTITYSVVDAESGIGETGLDFEEVG